MMLSSFQIVRNFFTPILGILNLVQESEGNRPRYSWQNALCDGQPLRTRCDTITGVFVPEVCTLENAP
jgi:hypothetical protein